MTTETTPKTRFSRDQIEQVCNQTFLSHSACVACDMIEQNQDDIYRLRKALRESIKCLSYLPKKQYPSYLVAEWESLMEEIGYGKSK